MTDTRSGHDEHLDTLNELADHLIDMHHLVGGPRPDCFDPVRPLIQALLVAVAQAIEVRNAELTGRASPP